MNFTVYKHVSPSGKVYIGITSQKPESRWGRDGSGYKHSPHFLAAIRKYGWANFTHQIIAEGLSKEQAETMEVELIAKYDSTNRLKGYNAELGGNSPGRCPEELRKKMGRSGPEHHYYGKHLSAEHRRKLSESHKGVKLPPRSEEHRQKLRDANTGKHPSEETRQKLRTAKLGRQLSEETRQKMSAAQKERHRRNREEVVS